MIGRETVPGQQPAVPGGGDPTGFFEWKLPSIMAPSGEQGTQAGTSDAFEKVQYPGFVLELPSGRGQESPQEMWNSMPVYEKWGVILHNAHKQGGNWLRDFINFGLTGRPGQGKNQPPFFDDKLLSTGIGDAIKRAIEPYLDEKRRYQRWKPNQYQPERQRR